MARYIDADTATQHLRNKCVAKYPATFMNGILVAANEIDRLPTADVAKVVRCKDCEMFVEDKKALVTYCKRELKNLTVKADDFCSYGEKREWGKERT